MKEYFNNGSPSSIRTRPKGELAKVPAISATSQAENHGSLRQGDRRVSGSNKVAPEKDPNIISSGAHGRSYDLAGRNDDAINAYQQAVTLKPIMRVTTQSRQRARAPGKIDDARIAYTKSAELDPRSRLRVRNFGIVVSVEPYAGRRRPQRPEIDPKNAQSWYLLAPAWLLCDYSSGTE